MEQEDRQERMGVARFVTVDPYRPSETNEEVDELLEEMDGVIAWTIHDNGEVTVEYEMDRINDGMIEDALTGVGLRLKHIFDKRDATEDELESALDF